ATLTGSYNYRCIRVLPQEVFVVSSEAYFTGKQRQSLKLKAHSIKPPCLPHNGTRPDCSGDATLNPDTGWIPSSPGDLKKDYLIMSYSMPVRLLLGAILVCGLTLSAKANEPTKLS